MDPSNPIVQLCAQGMQAEGEGKLAEAQAYFQKAWNARQNDFEACIAAHFMARHQPSAETLHWNQVALHHAEAVNDERVQGFYPSLYLNLGWAYEQLGNLVEASRYYALAQAHLVDLADDAYGTVVRKGVTAGQKRVAQAQKE